MKKVFALMLAALMLLSMAACSTGGATQTTGTAQTAGSDAAATAETVESRKPQRRTAGIISPLP